jgi:hypothetical protein
MNDGWRCFDRGQRQLNDRVRLAATAAASTLRCGQPRRHAHQPLLEAAGHVPAVLDRPQPLLAQRARPADHLRIHQPRVFSQGAAELADRDGGQRVLVYVHSDHDH